jgi:hypothetical protein
MTRKAATPKATPAPATRPVAGLAPLVAELRRLIQSARHAAAPAVNTLQVLTNFEIGRRIAEHERNGKQRAEYDDLLVSMLAIRLSDEFGRGLGRLAGKFGPRARCVGRAAG